MSRYDYGFRMLPPHEQRSGIHKAWYAQGAIVHHRMHGFGSDEDGSVVREFDLSGMNEFWDLILSEPIICAGFARVLADHFYEVKLDSKDDEAENLRCQRMAAQIVGGYEGGIRQALRVARGNGEPWFVEAIEPRTKMDEKAWLGFVPSDTYIESLAPPADGIDLSKLKVRPRAAVEWLIAMPKRRHLVPPSLAAVMTAKAGSLPALDTGAPVPESSGAPGRPTSMHLVEAEMARRGLAGDTASTMAQEALALEAWLTTIHPQMPRLGKKRIQNVLGAKFKRIPK